MKQIHKILQYSSATSPLPCPRLQYPIIPKVIVLVTAAVIHLCTVSNVIKPASNNLRGWFQSGEPAVIPFEN